MYHSEASKSETFNNDYIATKPLAKKTKKNVECRENHKQLAT